LPTPQASALDAFQVYVRGGNHAQEQRVGLCYYAMCDATAHAHLPNYPTEAAIPGWPFGGVYRFTKKRFFEEIMPIMLHTIWCLGVYNDGHIQDLKGWTLFACGFIPVGTSEIKGQ
jgi:hypothetical protein